VCVHAVPAPACACLHDSCSGFCIPDVCVCVFALIHFTKTDTVLETDGLGPFDVHSLKCDVVADVAIDQKRPWWFQK